MLGLGSGLASGEPGRCAPSLLSFAKKSLP
jgi:hypothetical protein